MKIYKFGFTLIELLVVIAIIGVILVYTTANYLTAQKQARDARRLGDMEASQTALETYMSINGVYPVTDPEINSSFDSGARPTDPKPGSSYTWNTDTDSYCICSTMEAKTGNADSGTADACSWSATGQLFCVQNRQ